ncbi:hypothetical protein C8R42DRAFT_645272 [Lentinula raphanica]|nr:hypothetical protein C8R42DRAFT_645272 [Lentinula raphanica]
MSTSMSRFTQYEEDASRLPEGFQRVAYDADTQRYTFRDSNGALYQSASGETYGKLTPLSDPSRVEAWRYDETGKARERLEVSTSKLSFHDILPPHAITSARSSSSPTSPSTPTSSNSDSSYPSPSSLSPRARFVEAARRSTLPKMQGVVHNLRRTVTLAARKQSGSGVSPEKEENEEKIGLLVRSQSVVSSHSSVMTTQTQLTLVNEKRV